MTAAVAVRCRVHTVDLLTEDMERCQRSAGFSVSIESDCSGEANREVCDSHLLTLKRGLTKCIDGRHVVRLITAARIGGAK